MRITFAPHRAAVFSSFLGLLDIKLGAEIILLFGLINKVAGLYGLVTIFVGGSFVQLLFYAYSVATLFAFLWALNIIKSETAAPTLLVSYLYTIDHLLLSLFHYIFYHRYWFSIPHDGRRTINSQAQQDLIDLAVSRGEVQPVAVVGGGGDAAELRKALAGEIWDGEKGFAVWVLVLGWALKIYFILVLYSYAAHLGSASYHTLPLTARGKATRLAHPDPASSSSASASASALASTGGSLTASPRIPGESEDDLELRRAEQAAHGPDPGDGGSRNGQGKMRENGKGEDEQDFSWE